MKKFEVICYGALGGLCPSLAKLAGSYSANPDQNLPIIGVYVALFLFAVLGAIVSLGFGTQEVRAAIVAGIAAPAIVTNVLAGVENRDERTAALRGLLAEPAFAQGVTSVQLTQGVVREGQTYVTITPNVVGGQTVQTPLVYQWVREGQVLMAPAIADNELALSGRQSILVPDGATGLLVNGAVMPLEQIIANDYNVDLTVKTGPTFAGDLIWGLGGTRRLVIQSVEFDQ